MDENRQQYRQSQEVSWFKDPDEQAWTLAETRATFRVRSLHWQDAARHTAYQALRYQIFSQQLHWAVAVTADGREVDRYDQCATLPVWTHVVYVLCEQQEVLLAGVRTCAFRDWQETMVMAEMQAAGLFPSSMLSVLCATWQPKRMLEITRLCVRRDTTPGYLEHATPRHLKVAQDLIYTGVYQVAEQTGRSLVLAVVSAGQRIGFLVQICYAHALDYAAGYALVVVDLAASIHAMRAQGKVEQATRFLMLCQNRHWIEDMAERDTAKVTCKSG